MNDLCTALFCLDHVGKRDRMGLRHIAAHN
jgi:hypothetical protein